MANRLKAETSPYLLQHAENPVDWYPWGEEALARARGEDKPILLSIGYSACHWCHVMERESFENEDIARIMNENFVNIKVDREERPDLDGVYMEAVQALAGTGGWPLTVFLTPEGKPFFGGTYFPPDDRPGQTGFPGVLRAVTEAYRTRKEEVESAARQVVAHLGKGLETQRRPEPLTDAVLRSAYVRIKSMFDSANGGFGSAPKFPQPMILEFLLRYHVRTGDQEPLAMVERTLERMARGGVYDQLGGGFHRYSTDARWLVPHFEKMLYDNALLSRVYLHAYQVTGKQLYRRIAQETLGYMLREMTDEEGGFFATQDADTEGIEGKFYVWTFSELVEALGEDEADLAGRYFGVTEQGNFEGANVLSQAATVEDLASELGLEPDEVERRVAVARARLLERRALRVGPHRDEKVLADWNGLALASLAEAALVLDRGDYLEAAVKNAAFLTRALLADELKHSYKGGQARVEGYLQDYALLAEGLLVLHQASFEGRWLQAAVRLGDAILDRFWDEAAGCFYDTGHGQEATVVRPRNVYDNAVPSGPAAAAAVLLRLARLTGDRKYERPAAAALRSVQELMVKYPIGFGHWLCALDFYLSRPKEIAVVGPRTDPAVRSLMSEISRRYLPNMVLAARDPAEPPPAPPIPLLQDRGMIGDQPTVYVCEGHACRTPVTEPGALATVLDAVA